MPILDRDALNRAFALAERRVTAGELPFAILAVAGADGLVRMEAYSQAGGTRLGSKAVCLLASITKPIFATLVLRLVADGRFSLEEPLARWLPELAEAGHAPFSAWHVLTHTTGIPDVDIEGLLLGGGTRDDVLRATIAAGQGSVPGSTFLYASSTFDLLAEAVTRATGRPYEELVSELVLEPLGMEDTGFEPFGVGVGRLAPVQFGGSDGSRRPETATVPLDVAVRAFSAMHLAGAGLWSTASDLVRFGRAMLRGGELDGARVLPPRIVELMTREVTVDGLGAAEDRLLDGHYAIGWGKPGAASPASAAAFGHGGISGTRLWIDPAHDLVFVFLSGVWGLAGQVIDDQQLAVYAALR
ncbi:MAG: serine hydrolase [Chloroflexota bacterium]